VYTFSQMIIL